MEKTSPGSRPFSRPRNAVAFIYDGDYRSCRDPAAN